MIIKRQYETYGMLMTDEKTKAAIYDALSKSNRPMSKERIERIVNYIHWIRFDQTDLGSGIPGECYQLMKKAFEELDKTDPFDNHLTYRDVTQVLTFPSRKGNAIELFLIRGETAELGAEIVQIIAFEQDGNGVKAIEPWD